MGHKIGLSGSTILTDPDKFNDLFNQGINHIEIGEFPNEEAFQTFLQLKAEKGSSFGIHSPLFRHQSKYDLLEKVQFEPEQAWEQFEAEVEKMSQLGAEYLLVHFPYFKTIVDKDANGIIENGLKRLSLLQQKYEISIVCEPKLGVGRSSVGIDYLDDFPIKKWKQYGLHLCIDIGDYLIATGNQIMTYIKKWKKHIKVVHLHNVEIHNNKYIWVPVHPNHENDDEHYQVKEVIQFLATCKDVYFVFEHTPHTNPTNQFVQEGIDWVKKLTIN